ncbi:hypothetical protein ACIO08_05855 [Avibacterium paragallinarum]
MSQDPCIPIWKKLNLSIKNITSYQSFDIPDDVKNIIEDLNTLFNQTIFNLLKNDKTKEIYYLLKEVQEIIENSGQAISSLYEEQRVIRDMEKFKKLLQDIKEKFNTIENIDSYIESYKKIYEMGEKAIEEAQKSYNERVAELLGKTTETYLFSEYQKQADTINNRISNNTWAFFIIIILLIAFAICSLIHLPSSQGNNWIPYIFIRIFIAFTAFYALVFLNRSIRDDRKLEQTYRHKEVVSKSYLNYLEFLDKNVMISYNNKDGVINNGQIIKEKVSQIAVESLGINPALLLDKSTAEKIPMEELLSRILDKTTTTKKGE